MGDPQIGFWRGNTPQNQDLKSTGELCLTTTQALHERRHGLAGKMGGLT